MAKYEPLGEHLKGLQQQEWRATFADVERLVQGKLPRSAYEHQAWWSNNAEGHSHARSWLGAGWKTEKVNMLGKTLVFRRLDHLDTASSQSGVALWGCLKGTVQALGGHDLTTAIDADWRVK